MASKNPIPTTNHPEPKTGSWTARNFRFGSGDVLPELRLAYSTIGDPRGEPVMILHGSNSSGGNLLTPHFAGELFGPGQPLDASRYFIILPDSIGTGRSSKPSDGLRAKFPRYNYDDCVRAQHVLLTEHLGIDHLRLLLGHSMGGMQTWIWAQKYPRFMDVAVPMASQPGPMSGRNWMLRGLLIDAIPNDPDWLGGNYEAPPRGWKAASIFFSVATNGGTQALHKLAPTREQADALVDQRLTAPMPGDANDHLFQWNASRDYDPSAGLEKIEAAVLAINAADDERNPPELGLLERAIARLPNGRLLLIPATSDTAGHGTTEMARLWKDELAALLMQTARRPAL